MKNKHIDHINKRTMRVSVSDYNFQDQLTPHESAALSEIDTHRDLPILDIGIGGGRTVKSLSEFSSNYVGIDYVHEMVTECQNKFPDLSFQQGDARDLSSFEDGSFNTIIFSMNGISMVDHEGRIQVLKEMYRLLSPGGAFLFSTYNLDNMNYKKYFHFPTFQFSANPLKFGVRTLRFSKNMLISLKNRLAFRKHETYTDEYAIINDKCHNYGTMLYYLTKSSQEKQLKSIGFSPEIKAFDLLGNLIQSETDDDSIFYIARKPA